MLKWILDLQEAEDPCLAWIPDRSGQRNQCSRGCRLAGLALSFLLILSHAQMGPVPFSDPGEVSIIRGQVRRRSGLK